MRIIGKFLDALHRFLKLILVAVCNYENVHAQFILGPESLSASNEAPLSFCHGESRLANPPMSRPRISDAVLDDLDDVLALNLLSETEQPKSTAKVANRASSLRLIAIPSSSASTSFPISVPSSRCFALLLL